jgi:hypothetical protein
VLQQQYRLHRRLWWEVVALLAPIHQLHATPTVHTSQQIVMWEGPQSYILSVSHPSLTAHHATWENPSYRFLSNYGESSTQISKQLYKTTVIEKLIMERATCDQIVDNLTQSSKLKSHQNTPTIHTIAAGNRIQLLFFCIGSYWIPTVVRERPGSEATTRRGGKDPLALYKWASELWTRGLRD